MACSIDFDAAIAAHRHWLKQVTAHGQGVPVAAMDLDGASDHERCELGRWLDGDGLALAPLRSYADLVVAHKLFHTTAGDVICLLREQQTHVADLVIREQLTALSTDIVHLIRQLQEEARLTPHLD